MVFQPGEPEAAEQPYMAGRLRGGGGALSSLHLFLTTQAGQLLLSSPAPLRTAPHQIRSPSGLPRERPPCTASRAWGSLTPSAPPEHTPCPSQAVVGLHFLISREKNYNKHLNGTIFDVISFQFLLLHPTSPGVGGNNASAAFTGTETGHAVAEAKMHPYSMFGASVGTTFTPLVQKLAHSLPPTSNRAACQVSGESFTDSVLQRPHHL